MTPDGSATTLCHDSLNPSNLPKIDLAPEPTLLLQRVLTNRPTATRPLYWHTKRDDRDGAVSTLVEVATDGELKLGVGTTIAFDTYFNGFFEQNWRRSTRLNNITLELRATGSYDLQLFRRTGSETQLLHEETVRDRAEIQVSIDYENVNFRQNGFLYFALTARDASVLYQGAAWTSRVAGLEQAQLGIVFCTFNREADIAKVLHDIVQDKPVLDRLARIIVVNQGRPGLAIRSNIVQLVADARGKIDIVEQSNFGGAGGFSRGLLELLDDPKVTHVAFLDDDITIEPDSLLRMASFFSLAEADIAVGGHMLDSVQRTRLYEAGATIAPKNWTFHPQHYEMDIADTDNLVKLLAPYPIHYNGWWCFGFSKQIIDRVGMPLPCFIRGDDVEYGLRLYQSGITTVPVPGIAVWHEPFYLKAGGWQLYYETRNMLVAAALHYKPTPYAVTSRMLKHLLLQLLTFRYYGAALIVRAVEDYLEGPDLFEDQPQDLHLGLGAIKCQYPASTTPRHRVLGDLTIPHLPKRRPLFIIAFFVTLLRNAVVEERSDTPLRMDVRNFSWFLLKNTDHVAVETWWDEELPTYHRSRADFRSIVKQAVPTLFKLYRRTTDLNARWSRAAPRLTSVSSWKNYLSLPRD